MIIRIWRTSIVTGRAEEYAAFERERSVPMFREQDGCLGVLFVRSGSVAAAAISFWRDHQAVEALADSRSYLGTVSDIKSSGLIGTERQVDVFAFTAAWISDDLGAELGALSSDRASG